MLGMGMGAPDTPFFDIDGLDLSRRIDDCNVMKHKLTGMEINAALWTNGHG